MTAPRHGSDAGEEGPRAPDAYGTGGGFEAAVGRLADPLNDPLPGSHDAPWSQAEESAPRPDQVYGGDPSPYRPQGEPDPWAGAPVTGYGPGPGAGSPVPAASPGHAGPQHPLQEPQYGPERVQEPPDAWYEPDGYRRDWYGRYDPEGYVREDPAAEGTPGAPVPQAAGRPSGPLRSAGAHPAGAPAPGAGAVPGAAPFAVDETVALPPTRAGDGEPTQVFSPIRDGEPTQVFSPIRDGAAGVADGPARTPGAGGSGEPPATGGRAERRKAAKSRGRRRPAAAAGGGAGTGAGDRDDAAPPVPMTRLEARRAARAAKDSPAVVASRAAGEIFISLGVLMLLFVAYQLWWTNVRADQIAGNETHKIQDSWSHDERDPGTFEPGQGFAIMHIPKLDVVAPIAEGVSKEKVLDRGMIGHYAEGRLKTAMPSDARGNFALAAHRNTHGEPFRYINKLVPGDTVVVETRDRYYTYEMTSTLPQTAPSNVSVIDPVPAAAGFKEPGRYITLTTCTPEFTSTYRLIVWGKMVDERPRSEGKPDALVG
ncbi:class E sortase [uncultured Streptomyces sp.]|uniref:class E sortase n=1 Tax=uncultured Streptomyces sp. TaxID=174707 RepID=UPI0026349ABB|nr:class E sortase [uncultured Streptomyces sp.]